METGGFKISSKSLLDPRIKITTWFTSEVALPKRLYQGDTSVVLLSVLRPGVEFLCCLHRMYIFIFLVKFK